MAGRHPKGTNDADANGKQGGSLPEKSEARIARLEDEIASIKALMRCNGWSMKD